MVIPQSLAYAQIAHLPKQYGLYSAYLCCFIYALCGTAKDVSVGPTSILSLITYSAVAGDITKSIALAACCGILQTTLAIFQLGVLFDFISDPVIAGFTSSTALIIASTQVKDLFGFKPRTSHIYYTVYDTFAHIPDMSWGDTVMGVGCIVFLLLITFIHRRIRPGMPWAPTWMTASRYAHLCILYSARYAILVTITTCMSYGLGSHITWKRVDYMPRGLPEPTTPHIVWETITEYYADILSLAIVGFLESIAIAKAFARENGYQHTLDGNQELFAVGVANLLSSFFNSYAVTGSFSRTSVNAASGAHTPVSSAVTGIVVIFAISFLTPTFAWIPVACLAAIVISAALPLCDFNYPLQLYRTMQYYDLATYVVAFVGCLLLDIQWGMLAACGLSLLIVLYQQARPKYEVYSVEGERDSIHLVPFHPTSHPHVPILNATPSPSSSSSSSTSSIPLLTSHTPNILLFRISSPLIFLNITYIQQHIISLYHCMSTWDGDGVIDERHDAPHHDVSLYPTTLNVQPIHQHDVHDVSPSHPQHHDSHPHPHPHPHLHPHPHPHAHQPTLLIDFLHITSIDTSGLRLLMDLIVDGCEHGVMTHFVNVKADVEMKMRYGFPSTLFPSGLSSHLHSSVDEAYASITSPSISHPLVNSHSE